MDILSVEKIAGKALKDMGYRLVSMRSLSHKEKRLELLIEKLDRTSVTVGECVKAHRAVITFVSVDEPEIGDYALEVSSPGVDRPLVTLEDYAHYVNYKAFVETDELVDGRKRFRGFIVSTTPEIVVIKLEEEDGTSKDYALPFIAITKGKLDLDFVLDLEKAKRKQK